MKDWLTRWRLKRIIAALSFATDYGLRAGVVEFAQALEATALMSQSAKKGELLTIQVEKQQLNEFITYMTRLHSSKLSLWHRARIGLATLMLKDANVLGESAMEFMEREFPKSKSKKDDNVIQLHR